MQKSVFIALLSLICLFFSCKKDLSQTIKSAEVTVADGKAYTWVKTDSDNNFSSMGFTLSAGAFTNLPDGVAAMGHSTNFRLALPVEATTQTPFDHLDLGWVAHGHEPSGIYDKPHFDIHFYTVTPSEHDAIPPYQVDSTGFKKNPPTGSIPASYAKNPAGVPGMGCHWTDKNAVEFKGQPFTETFIFGSYNGKVNFWESMIALETLTNNPAISRSIPQPTVYEQTGRYYPTTLSVVKVGADVVYTLGGFVKR